MVMELVVRAGAVEPHRKGLERYADERLALTVWVVDLATLVATADSVARELLYGAARTLGAEDAALV